MNADSLASSLARADEVAEEGQWQRHVPAHRARSALDGRRGYGRWGTKTGFPVLYLGRPRESIVVEAYRHLIDPTILDDPVERERFIDSLQPRMLVTCTLAVKKLLDLRVAHVRAFAGLTMQDLTSPTNDSDAYARCQKVAEIAHQLGRHGIITPAATQRGETLALFTDLLPAAERPSSSTPDELWSKIPNDPREMPEPRLRIVRPEP